MKMRVWIWLALLALASPTFAAPANNLTVRGTIVPGHTASFFSKFQLQDSGGAAVAVDADRTGVADVSAKVAAALATTAPDGSRNSVYLPAGKYRFNSSVTVTQGQCIYGDGGNTVVYVDQAFSTSALGVFILLDNAESPGKEAGNKGPCVHNITFYPQQPLDQGTRANFKTLAAGCTSGTGGTGCKYPAMIYTPTGYNGRHRIWNVNCFLTWRCIEDHSAHGIYIAHVRDGSLDQGITLDHGLDFGVVDDLEHWGFAQNINAPPDAAIYSGVFKDGNTKLLVVGQLDGTHFTNIRTFTGRIQLTSDYTWGHWDNISMDGDNSTFELTSSINPGVIMSDFYATGGASGANSHCSLDIMGGTIFATNVSIQPQKKGLCVASGSTVTVTGGSFIADNTVADDAQSPIQQTGGNLDISTVILQHNSGTYTQPTIKQTGGCLQAHGIFFRDARTNSGGIGVTDAACNDISGNYLNGWTLTGTGSSGNYAPNGLNSMTSAQLAAQLTNEVGSGSVILSNNPVFGGGQFDINQSTSALWNTNNVNLQGANGSNMVVNIEAAGAAQGVIEFARTGGTWASKSVLASGDSLGALSWGSYNSSAFAGDKGVLRCTTSEVWTTGANGTKCEIMATPTGSTGLQSEMNFQSGVAAGSGAPKGYGTIFAPAGLYGNASTLQSDNPNANQGQLSVKGNTDANKQLYLGLDTTNNQGLLQAYWQGTSALPLLLNPAGGNVGVSITGGTAPIAGLDVNNTVRMRNSVALGTATMTLGASEIGFTKAAASGSAPGAGAVKFGFVCGTLPGSAKIIAYAGTSTTPVTVIDNIGSGVTGC